MEKVYPQFEKALIIGKYNEEVIAHECAYQGIPLIQAEGKDDFDFHLPDGRSLEAKIDLRSQCTGYGAMVAVTTCRPPLGRRTRWPSAARCAAGNCNSAKPAVMVGLDNPVARATSVTPPQPASRASAAAH